MALNRLSTEHVAQASRMLYRRGFRVGNLTVSCRTWNTAVNYHGK